MFTPKIGEDFQFDFHICFGWVETINQFQACIPVHEIWAGFLLGPSIFSGAKCLTSRRVNWGTGIDIPTSLWFHFRIFPKSWRAWSPWSFDHLEAVGTLYSSWWCRCPQVEWPHALWRKPMFLGDRHLLSRWYSWVVGFFPQKKRTLSCLRFRTL